MSTKEKVVLPTFNGKTPNYQDTLKMMQPSIESGKKALQDHLKRTCKST
jgi:hypothetical protein